MINFGSFLGLAEENLDSSTEESDEDEG